MFPESWRDGRYFEAYNLDAPPSRWYTIYGESGYTTSLFSDEDESSVPHFGTGSQQRIIDEYS